MPKQIAHLEQDILAAARQILLAEGYEALTMRRVARQCGIAVGTLYNYSSSKEMLAGSVMLEDWRGALAQMDAACASAPALVQGLRAVYDGVAAFAARYGGIWDGCGLPKGGRGAFAARHRLLVRQLAACVGPLLARTAPGAPAGADVFLAENILLCANGSELPLDTLLQIAQSFADDASARQTPQKAPSPAG